MVRYEAEQRRAEQERDEGDLRKCRDVDRGRAVRSLRGRRDRQREEGAAADAQQGEAQHRNRWRGREEDEKNARSHRCQQHACHAAWRVTVDKGVREEAHRRLRESEQRHREAADEGP